MKDRQTLFFFAISCIRSISWNSSNKSIENKLISGSWTLKCKWIKLTKWLGQVKVPTQCNTFWYGIFSKGFQILQIPKVTNDMIKTRKQSVDNIRNK